jgi:hypothetical protein
MLPFLQVSCVLKIHNDLTKTVFFILFIVNKNNGILSFRDAAVMDV